MSVLTETQLAEAPTINNRINNNVTSQTDEQQQQQQPQQLKQQQQPKNIVKDENIPTDFKKKSEDLKSRYTSAKRNQEIISVVLFVVFLILSVYKMFSLYFVRNIWIFLLSSMMAMVAADFFSGIVHWAADTWGSLDTPLVGNSFIRSFREHHVAPTAMTKHDYIETNGDNCMLTVPVLAFTAYTTIQENYYDMFLLSFLVKLAVWVSLTNQIHKWSHTYHLPSYVKFMQKYGIIISKRDHAIHHRNPFDKYYCITNGWLNPWLASIGFWKRLEEIITLTTGAIPRKDDQDWTN